MLLFVFFGLLFLEGRLNLFFFCNNLFEDGGGLVVIVGVKSLGLFVLSDILRVIILLFVNLLCKILVMRSGMYL